MRMIIVRSPLRISLGGGGTDLPSYYEKFGGFLVAGAINKYVYVTVNRPFSEGISVKYSRIENVDVVDDIQHPIIREALRLFNLATPQIEISTIADIPTGTGLGSSGSFTTALLKAIHTHRRTSIHSNELAELACHIEIEKLGEPIGKQDQYIAAYGGISSFTFNEDGSIEVVPLRLSQNTMIDLEDNLLLFFTGISRSASAILYDQNSKLKARESEMIDSLHIIKDLGFRSRDALLAGDTKLFGELMHEHWQHKKIRTQGISSDFINDTYEKALANGAIGGKIVGAGGGGFFLFYASDRNQLRHAMREAGLKEMRFGFDFEGTKVILS